MSNAAIDDIITRAETKKTKESSKWARRVFESEFFFLKSVVYLLKFLAKTIKISELISWRTHVYNQQRHIFSQNTKIQMKIIFHNSCQFMPFSFNSLVHLKKAC